MTDSIKLAKAMGLTTYKDGERILVIVHHRPNDGNFDPFTDANDCEALIVFLNEQGWEIEIDFNIGAQGVVMWREDKSLDCYAGNNWKQGVCELALKVIK